MRVIFLDIDGVLNCKSTPNPRKLPYIVDRELLERLLDLIDRTRASVVLTSTWRYDPAGQFSARHWGIPFTDVVPDLPGQPRRDEIVAWLRQQQSVERYAVMDDDDDELDDLPLFQPSPRTGLTQEIVEGVVAYLQGRTDADMRRSLLTRLTENILDVTKGHKG
jgi:hypothetical protein